MNAPEKSSQTLYPSYEQKQPQIIQDKRKGLSTLIIMMWIALVAMVGCTVAAELIPLNGVTTKEVSDSLFVLFSPAGYVFSIWSLIYVGLFVWLTVFTARLRESGYLMYVSSPMKAKGGISLWIQNEYFEKMAALFIATCALNVIWLITWHFMAYFASVFVMIGLLATLASLYFTLKHSEELSPKPLSFMDKLCWLAPISLYLGWISVALVANVSFVLTDISLTVPWVPAGELLLVFVLTVIGAGLVSRFHFDDYVIPGVFIWALIGIGVKLLPVFSTLAIGILVLTALFSLVIYAPWMRLRKKKVAHAE